MLLATTAVEDYDRFVKVFSTKGAEKRKQHGSQGATVFRDPSQEDRVWVVFDWDAEGWQSFVSDPEIPGDHAGGRPQGQAAGVRVRRPLRGVGLLWRARAGLSPARRAPSAHPPVPTRAGRAARRPAGRG